MAIIAAQQKNFKKFWKMHYTRRLRSTHNMSQEGTGQEGVVVLVHNKSINSDCKQWTSMTRVPARTFQQTLQRTYQQGHSLTRATKSLCPETMIQPQTPGPCCDGMPDHKNSCTGISNNQHNTSHISIAGIALKSACRVW